MFSLAGNLSDVSRVILSLKGHSFLMFFTAGAETQTVFGSYNFNSWIAANPGR